MKNKYQPVNGLKGKEKHHAKLWIEARRLLAYLCQPDGTMYPETKKIFPGHMQRSFVAQIKKLHKQVNTPVK